MEGKKEIRLTRYFSLTSLLGIGLVLAGLASLFHRVVVEQMVEHEGRSNEALTQSFAGAVLPPFMGFVASSSGMSREQLLASPEVRQLHAKALEHMKGLSVVKIKLYNLDGLTLYSTDARQIGEDKSGNPGFQSARAGRQVSDITFRDRFDAFEGVLVDRSLVYSYVPLRPKPGAPAEGVFEIYSDVTDLVAAIGRAKWQIATGLFAGLGLLYVFLFLIVRRAEVLIRAQEQDRQSQEEAIRYQAYHDPLTGLPNRRGFGERMAESVRLARRTGRRLGLMFIDLDRFKLVNDSLGHDAGDQLLRIIAKRLGACVRESDLVFRMGGDEFTVILEALDQPEDAAIVARRVIQALAEPLHVFGHEISAGGSIGITVYPNDGQSAEELVRNADTAMYLAKESGRGRYEFYTQEMNARAMERLALEAALQKALRDEEFEVHYQARVSSGGSDVVAAEALLRWRHPEKGLIMPGDFIGVLEDTGLIVPVGEWVLREACLQAGKWRQAGTPLRISVNVSSRQFRSEMFAALVERTLHETGLPPPMLELELTESLLIENVERALTTMRQLKALGVVLSIDDFGSGYSSLNYLRRFPVDYLKIDRSFVADLNTEEKDRAIASAVAALARTLNIGVVAEGVEDESQAEFLRRQNCDEFQGYLFCRPMPAQELEHILQSGPLALREAASG